MFVVFVIFVILAIAAILLSERTIEKIACAHGRSRKIADATMTGIVTLLCIMDSAYAFAISVGSIPKWICIIALIVLLVLAADRETIIIGIILSLMLVVITLFSLAGSREKDERYNQLLVIRDNIPVPTQGRFPGLQIFASSAFPVSQ